MARWYVAILVLECRIASSPDGTVDLQVRVISAESHDHAFEKAQLLGQKAEERYVNSDGEEVTWVFRGLHDLDDVYAEVLEDGTEVWSLRSSRPVASLVRPREELSAFWLEANEHRTVREVVGDE